MKHLLTSTTSLAILIVILMACPTYVIAQNQPNPNANSNALNNNGNVGIGTTNPTHKLEVVGSSKFTGTMEVDSASLFNDSIIMMSSRVKEDLIVEGDIIMRKYIDESTILPKSLVVKPDGEIATQDEVYCVGPDAQGNYFASWSYDPNIIYTYCHEQVFKVGINTDNPQSALDVRGNQYLSGKLGIGVTPSGYKLDVNGNQHISGLLNVEKESATNQKLLTLTSKNTTTPNRSMFFVSKSDGWPTPIAEDGDFGIFWNDNEGIAGNLNAGFAIAPSGYFNNSEIGLRITNQGWVGIGQAEPQSMLAVNGKITAKEVEVTLTGFSDFVFNDNYKLKPLKEVEQFIKNHKHLPDVPSEQEVIENGLNLGEMDALLLQKVEELTLYVIELNKKIQEQEIEIHRLQAQEQLNPLEK
ncbi:MAG: hypothetical protein K9H64_03840 [Bacteroidales bacterium]|nr:hypothetical protein [Bacteroidales bacterium]MCF8454965.1 hypothetical protein [Bacteroidales bacterium]